MDTEKCTECSDELMRRTYMRTLMVVNYYISRVVYHILHVILKLTLISLAKCL